jgi:hypothetical protein
MTALRVLFGLGYAVMGTFCAAGLLSQPGPDRHGTIAIASFITAISFGGLVLILFILVFPRFRPGAALGTAPSGLPAVVFRRLPVMMLVSTSFCAFLVGWSGWLASVLHENGHEVWASLSVAFALLMLWPLAVLVSGRIEPGGLWLTPIGLEYRNEAVSWTVPWSDLRRVDRTDVVPVGVLPDTVGRGRAAIEPLGLELESTARLEVRRTTRWIWNREHPVSEWEVCIDCFDLAGGRQVIADLIERHLRWPRSREHLGTRWSLSRLPF